MNHDNENWLEIRYDGVKVEAKWRLLIVAIVLTWSIGFALGILTNLGIFWGA